jgi:hypothetical protein
MAKTTVGKFAVYRRGRQIYFGGWDFPDLPGSVSARLRPVFTLAMASLAEIDQLETELREAGELSEKGIEARMKDRVNGVLADFREARRTTLNQVRVRLAEEHAAMRGKLRREPGDVVGELSDQERRAFLRSLKGDDRLKVLQEMMEGRRPELATAALRSERELSGLSDTAFANLQQKSMEAANPALWKALQEDERALQQVVDAIDTAEREIGATAAVPSGPAALPTDPDADDAADAEAA